MNQESSERGGSARRRRIHPPGFKAKVALAAMRTDKPLVELAREYEVHRNQVYEWRKHLEQEAVRLFKPGDARREDHHRESVQELLEKIGELTVERDHLHKLLE